MTYDYYIPTPDSILGDDDIDVFQEIIPDTDQYYLIKRSALWSFYGLRGIGNCDIAYWIKAMKLRYNQIKDEYDVRFKALQEWLDEIAAGPIDMSDNASQYTTRTENEDTPDNPQGDKVYLSDRNTVIYDGKSYSGLSSETVNQFIEAVPDLEKRFADEFKLQFYHGC